MIKLLLAYTAILIGALMVEHAVRVSNATEVIYEPYRWLEYDKINVYDYNKEECSCPCRDDYIDY